MACSSNTSSTSNAALSAMRLAPQLGQNPLRGGMKGFTNAMGAWMRRIGQLDAARCS
jgi:hypothetical protein